MQHFQQKQGTLPLQNDVGALLKVRVMMRTDFLNALSLRLFEFFIEKTTQMQKFAIENKTYEHYPEILRKYLEIKS